jgi:hypothetical protein
VSPPGGAAAARQNARCSHELVPHSARPPAAAPPGRPRAAFRPRLEALEDRQLLNASAAFDPSGNLLLLVADDSGTLTQNYLGKGATLAHDVLRAHVYRDSTGAFGMTVVYRNLSAYDYDHTGAHFLGTHILDVDKAYDRAGHVQEDVTYALSGPTFVTYEYTSFGAHQVATNGLLLLIHPFQDSKGNLGEDVSYFNTPLSSALVEYDSSGGHFEGNDIVVDRAWDLSGQQFAYAVVYFTSDLTTKAAVYRNADVIDLGPNIGP